MFGLLLRLFKLMINYKFLFEYKCLFFNKNNLIDNNYKCKSKSMIIIIFNFSKK